MEDHSIDETQQRLQLRKGEKKNKNQFQSPISYRYRGKSNPQSQTRSYLRPGKLYLRSSNPQNRKNYYSIDTDMSKLDSKRRESLSKDRNLEKLPPIKRLKLVSIDQMESKQRREHNYQNPTVSSQQLFEGKRQKLRNYDQKRICSVNCLRKEEKSKNAKNSLQTYQHRNAKHRCSTVIEDYLQNEAKSRYPQTQLREYLSRVKQVEKQQLIEKSQYQCLQFTTYFGLQPEFYKLETEYVKKIYNPDRSISSIENYKPMSMPLIPDKEDIGDFIESYVSIGKQINLTELLKQPNFLVQYTPFELYFGQMEAQQRQGLGVLISEKTCFEGLFRNNSKIKGVEITASGLYRGEFYKGKKDGSGEFQWINGQYYIGDWKDGHRHGKGVWTNKRGDSYNGQWIKGRGQGYGIYMSEGRQYHGDFLDFKKDGWGREKLQNGDYYEGGFKKGMPEGKGTYIWSNGTKYQGEFLHGFRNGKGVLSTLDGYVYNGQFVDEKPEGLCEILMPHGDIYQGYLRNGKKNGRGLLVLGKDKKTLDGYWQNDRFLGCADDF